jgi:hypothetical protein
VPEAHRVLSGRQNVKSPYSYPDRKILKVRFQQRTDRDRSVNICAFGGWGCRGRKILFRGYIIEKVRQLTRSTVLALFGECPPHEERTWTAHRLARMPMVTVPALGGITARSLIFPSTVGRMLVHSMLNSAGSRERLMVGRSLVFALVVRVCLAALVAPILVDTRHWWPRHPER